MKFRYFLFAALLCVSAGAAQAVTYDINYDIPGSFGIGSGDTVNMTSGTIDVYLGAHGDGIINMSGGSVGGLMGYDTSTINFSGGDVYDLESGSGPTTVNMTGGHILTYLQTWGGSTVTISGGEIDGSIVVGTGSTLNLFGQDLAFNPDPTAPLAGYGYGLPFKFTGHISDGTDFTGVYLYADDPASIDIINRNAASVPEPGSIQMLGALLGSGAFGLLRRRRA